MAERKRDYTKERLAEPASRRKDRAARNRARREAIREGRAEKGDNTVMHHVKPLSKGGSRNGKVVKQSRKASDSEGGRLQPKAAKRRGGRN
jgi:hypothetical protein